MNYPICIFEDSKVKNFFPLTYLRPVYDLRCGILTIREKFEFYFKPGITILHTREYLQNLLKEENQTVKVNEFDSEQILFINGRVLPDKSLVEALMQKENDEIFTCGDEIVAAKLSGKKVNQFIQSNIVNERLDTVECPNSEIECNIAHYPWDLVTQNGEEIKNDLALLLPNKVSEDIPGVYFLNKENIYLGELVEIKPNVTLNASDGPIFIDDNAKILPNSYIEGPAYIGKKSIVKANTQIYEDTSIGPVCKVGGEIENSIVHSYSNKQHDGFLGHAYLGSWINIGAGSNNSDLKNDYGKIKVILNGDEVNTDLQFVGLIMGDHSKCAINTMFNTGTIVGVSSNIYGAGFPARSIPSFSWGGSDGFREYHLRKAVEVAKTVKSRRNINMSTADLEVFKKVFELTQHERDDLK